MSLLAEYDISSLKDFLFPPEVWQRSPLVKYEGGTYDLSENDVHIYTHDGVWFVCMVEGDTLATVDSRHVAQFKCID